MFAAAAGGGAQGAMPADRVALLEAIDGWWWSAEDMPMDD
jgi:hypothetical protein